MPVPDLGPVVERFTYDSYGKRNASEIRLNTGFTGRYLDQETGLWFFRARLHDSRLGRFASRDWSSLFIIGYDENNNVHIAQNKTFHHAEVGLSVYRDSYSMYQSGFIPNAMDWTGLASSRDGEPCGIFEQWSTRTVVVDVDCWRRCEIQSAARTWYCWFCSDPKGKGQGDMWQMCRMVQDFRARPLRPGRGMAVFETQWKDVWWWAKNHRGCVVGPCGSGCDDKGVYY